MRVLHLLVSMCGNGIGYFVCDYERCSFIAKFLNFILLERFFRKTGTHVKSKQVDSDGRALFVGSRRWELKKELNIQLSMNHRHNKISIIIMHSKITYQTEGNLGDSG